MSESFVRLTGGRQWAAKQFVDHYFAPSGSGSPTPVDAYPDPVDIDRSWYMREGPGRYYHPGMFPVINQLISNRKIVPGPYDLRDLVPGRNEKHPC